ncbi:MAG: hypothetical protein J0L61_00730 [Planctomycetes bacterium]|nr:hypothetical protein [Planctomycetota bacterium]
MKPNAVFAFIVDQPGRMDLTASNPAVHPVSTAAPHSATQTPNTPATRTHSRRRASLIIVGPAESPI